MKILDFTKEYYFVAYLLRSVKGIGSCNPTKNKGKSAWKQKKGTHSRFPATGVPETEVRRSSSKTSKAVYLFKIYSASRACLFPDYTQGASICQDRRKVIVNMIGLWYSFLI
jgi:hypothetical protein